VCVYIYVAAVVCLVVVRRRWKISIYIYIYRRWMVIVQLLSFSFLSAPSFVRSFVRSFVVACVWPRRSTGMGRKNL
jgi:hypothetical protein